MTTPTWYPPFIAHRGGGKQAPENTLEAIQIGADYGFQMFECDVQASLDGELYLLHDDTLDRTTDGQGIACEKKWEELSQILVRTPLDFAHPLRIPRLAEVYAFSQKRKLAINLELKTIDSAVERTAHALADWLALQDPSTSDFPLVLSKSA